MTAVVCTCSWCGSVNDITNPPTFCAGPQCGHRADIGRQECDCEKCRRWEDAKDEHGNRVHEGDYVEFDRQGLYTGGEVMHLVRGVRGPIAHVLVASGVRLPVTCRLLTVVKRNEESNRGEGV